LKIVKFVGTTVFARLDMIDFQSSFDGRNTAKGTFSVGPLQHLVPHTAGNRSQSDRAMLPDRCTPRSLVRIDFFVA
jgi:hypothetical protein